MSEYHSSLSIVANENDVHIQLRKTVNDGDTPLIEQGFVPLVYGSATDCAVQWTQFEPTANQQLLIQLLAASDVCGVNNWIMEATSHKKRDDIEAWQNGSPVNFRFHPTPEFVDEVYVGTAYTPLIYACDQQYGFVKVPARQWITHLLLRSGSADPKWRAYCPIDIGGYFQNAYFGITDAEIKQLQSTPTLWEICSKIYRVHDSITNIIVNYLTAIEDPKLQVARKKQIDFICEIAQLILLDYLSENGPKSKFQHLRGFPALCESIAKFCPTKTFLG